MDSPLVKLPNELLELLAFYLIGRPWRNDLKDFLSFTSVCRRLRFLVHDERYWRAMALRRDPTVTDVENWAQHCRSISDMRTFLPAQLKERISRFDENYFCTVEKVQIWPDRVRIYIDERGDNSLGQIQDPLGSIIRIGRKDAPKSPYFRAGRKPQRGEFLIADPSSQYRGYLEFSVTISREFMNKSLLFEFGQSGYEEIVLLTLDENFFAF